MEDFVKRIIEERAELISKLNKLEVFKESDFCEAELSKTEQELLSSQIVVMEEYANVLKLRIEYYGFSV